MGSMGLDFLAAVSSYPKPDDKIRTTSLKVRELPPGLGLTRLCYYEALLLIQLLVIGLLGSRRWKCK